MMRKLGMLVAAALAASSSAPSAWAERADFVVIRCEVWAPGGEGGFHLRGYAEGMGESPAAAQAQAERDARQAYGEGQRLGPCVDMTH